MATGIGDKAMRRPKAHRLGIQQSRQESRRVVELEPGAHIHEVGKGHRVALGETVVGKGGELSLDGICDLAGDPAFGHLAIETGSDSRHAFGGTLRPHCLAELIRIGRREPGDIDGDLHHLLLEQRHPERLCEATLEVGGGGR